MIRISKRCIMNAAFHTIIYFVMMFGLLSIFGLIQIFANIEANFAEKFIMACAGAIGTNLGFVSGYSIKKLTEKFFPLLAVYMITVFFFEGISVLFSGDIQAGFTLHIFFIFAFVSHIKKGKMMREIEKNEDSPENDK